MDWIHRFVAPTNARRIFNGLCGFYWSIVSLAMAAVVKIVHFLIPAETLAGDTSRLPDNEDEARYWLSNMFDYHRFSVEEACSATGYSDSRIRLLMKRFRHPGNPSTVARSNGALSIRPYPGGRHPRIGFQDGAMLPRRDTKVSIFSPRDPYSYAVVDIPEVIFSNLGIIFVAHAHVPTVWDKRGIRLDRCEWSRRNTGSLVIHRRLPDGIEFGVRVTADARSATFRLWLSNHGPTPLSRIRIQNCILLGHLQGFETQTNRNKIFDAPYVACRSRAEGRWIIAASEPCWRVWANPLCPCMHSDARVPDVSPEETRELILKIWFYDGTEIYSEFRRLTSSGWN